MGRGSLPRACAACRRLHQEEGDRCAACAEAAEIGRRLAAARAQVAGGIAAGVAALPPERAAPSGVTPSLATQVPGYPQPYAAPPAPAQRVELRDEIACPWCAEQILARAQVCRHCGRDVEEEEPSTKRRTSERLTRAAPRRPSAPGGDRLRWLASVVWISSGSALALCVVAVVATNPTFLDVARGLVLVAALAGTVLYWRMVYAVARLLDASPALAR